MNCSKKIYSNLWDYFYLLYISTRDCPPLPKYSVQHSGIICRAKLLISQRSCSESDLNLIIIHHNCDVHINAFKNMRCNRRSGNPAADGWRDDGRTTLERYRLRLQLRRRHRSLHLQLRRQRQRRRRRRRRRGIAILISDAERRRQLLSAGAKMLSWQKQQ